MPRDAMHRHCLRDRVVSVYRMTSNPEFKDTPLFDVECVGSGKIMEIGTRRTQERYFDDFE